jgi:hypothetical protein
MNSNTPIEPDVITTTRTAVSFTVKCMTLTLFNNASFLASLLDISGNVISTEYITLTQEQYLEWNNNDEYIINLIAGILGVTPIPPPTENEPVQSPSEPEN